MIATIGLRADIKMVIHGTSIASYTTDERDMSAKPAYAIQELEELLSEIRISRQEADISNLPFDRAAAFISGLASELTSMPAAGVITIPQGAWIVWRTGNKNVQLLCSVNGEQEDFIYVSSFKDGQQYGVKKICPVSTKDLADQLRWMQAI